MEWILNAHDSIFDPKPYLFCNNFPFTKLKIVGGNGSADKHSFLFYQKSRVWFQPPELAGGNHFQL